MQLQDHGTIALIIPANQGEMDWLRDNVQYESWQVQGGALAVEPRMAEAIMEGFYGS